MQPFPPTPPAMSGAPARTLPVFFQDTESFLISPGCQAPPPVCLQFAVDSGEPEIIHARDPAFYKVIRWALENTLITGHSVGFDMAVIAAKFPDLLPLIFSAYELNRITCTAVRAKLLDIARGLFEGGYGKKWGYSLAECVQRASKGQLVLDKTDPWRMKYGTLWPVDVKDWPQEAINYAKMDVAGLRYLFAYQHQPDALADQFAQSRAAWWLELIRCRGIRTDPEYTRAYHAQFVAFLEEDRVIAQQAGLVRSDGSKDTKAAKLRMVQAMQALGEEPQLTDTGLVKMAAAEKELARKLTVWEFVPEYASLDEDACLASGDEVLLAYQRYSSASNRIARVERMFHGFELPLQVSYQSIVETGRTSCRQGDVEPGVSPPAWGIQIQNIPRNEWLKWTKL